MKIRGVNLGGWLMMEGYILHGRNIAEHTFKAKFKKIYGKKALREFEDLYRDTFITEEDFKNIAGLGATAIRLPFNHRIVAETPSIFKRDGFEYLDKALSWGAKHNVGIILDLHAAWGAQNHDWHSDSSGGALFWDRMRYQEYTCALWERIVEHVKDAPALIGYDVINEPVINAERADALNRFYKTAVRRIKAIDKKHLLFLEGNTWAQKIDCISDLLEENVAVSIHTYRPLNFTFNYTPFLAYPGHIENEQWDRGMMQKYLEPYYEYSRKNKVRIFVGEFGINWRGGFFGELQWISDICKTMNDFGFDYTYWTYKAVANNVFPDGIYQYIPNSKYVKREGPVYGFENYLEYWKKDKDEIVDFWRTINYTMNSGITETLRNYFKQ